MIGINKSGTKLYNTIAEDEKKARKTNKKEKRIWKNEKLTCEREISWEGCIESRGSRGSSSQGGV